MFRNYSKFIFLLFLINSLNVLGQVQVGENLEINYDYFSFATSVSIAGSGERVIVGGYGMNDWGFRVFDWDGYNWIQVGDNINTEFPAESSLYVVSMSENGNRIAVSSVINGPNADYGNVKVYDFIDGNWIQLGNTIIGESSNDLFGLVLSLSADGNRIIIGAKFSYNSIGSAEVYEYDGNDWIQLGSDIIGIEAGPYFGTSVSISPDGNRVAVGANQNNSSSGILKIYEYSVGINWVQIGDDLVGDDFGDGFGVSSALSFDGNRIIVGTIANTGSGYCKVFDYDSFNWEQIGQKIIGDNILDRFGRSVSISGDGTRIAVGAPSVDSGVNTSSSGYVKLFELNSSIWHELGEKMEGEEVRDEFGERIKLTTDGNTIIIGGLTYVYQEIGTEEGYAKVFDLSNLELSIEDYESNKITLYPNPVQSTLNINNISNSDITSISIYDVLGRLVLTQTEAFNQVDVSLLSNGLLFVKLGTEKGMLTKKIIKE